MSHEKKLAKGETSNKVPGTGPILRGFGGQRIPGTGPVRLSRLLLA